jgi:hypothetical protein
MANELATNLFTPRTFEEAREFARFISKTKFVPDAYKDKPDEILACIQYGSEIGISAMQSLQSIAVINGRPSLWGDVMLAMAQASGKLEYINEFFNEKGEAVCEVKRAGYPLHVTTWGDADSKAAGLLGKAGPHTQYKKRMQQMRARGFNLRDTFADVFKGIISREEAMDMPASSYKHVYSTNEPIVRPEDLERGEGPVPTEFINDAMSNLRDLHQAAKSLKVVADGVKSEVRDKSGDVHVGASTTNAASSATLTSRQQLRILACCERKGMSDLHLTEMLSLYGVVDVKDIKQEDMADLEKAIEAWEG